MLMDAAAVRFRLWPPVDLLRPAPPAPRPVARLVTPTLRIPLAPPAP
jgi:hypothetical protein